MQVSPQGALGGRLQADLQITIDQLDPAVGLGRTGQCQPFPGPGPGPPEPHRPIDGHGPSALLGIDQQGPAVAEFKGLLAVAGGEPLLARGDPDLQQPAALRPLVHLAVHDAAAGAHPLHLAGPQRFAVAHGVTVVQHPLHHHGDDLHVPVGVHAEAPAGRHPVVVDHQQWPEAPPGGVIVAGEAEAVPALQPAVAAVEAFGGRA